jgi:serine/threonine-protein kinase HipA
MSKCYSCFKETNDSYCRTCLQKLFDGKKINHILPFTRPEFNEQRINQSDRLSISGVQVKYSAKLEKKEIVLTEEGGRYILKPIPYGPFQHMDNIPANEHLTMQIATQVFDIRIPPNGIVYFKDGEIVYIVRRFDVLESGNKLLQEDFAQLANRSEENAGKNYKYDYSYEEMAGLMKKYVAAYPIEIERLFSRIVFNYLICNGDAHLKNFSLFRNEQFGDYTLTPAYDLMNTKIHIKVEPDTALELFKDDFMSEEFKAGSKYTRVDFLELGSRIGIKKDRVEKIISRFTSKEEKITELVNNSFLIDELKINYIENVTQRKDRLLK